MRSFTRFCLLLIFLGSSQLFSGLTFAQSVKTAVQCSNQSTYYASNGNALWWELQVHSGVGSRTEMGRGGQTWAIVYLAENTSATLIAHLEGGSTEAWNLSRPSNPVIAGKTAVCKSTPFETYSVNASGTDRYLWTVPADATIEGQSANVHTLETIGNSISVHFTTPGAISVTVKNACGDLQTVARSITVNESLLTLANVKGPTFVCRSSSWSYEAILTEPISPGDYTYSWSITGEATIKGSTTSSKVEVAFGVNAGAVKLVATVKNACGETSFSKDITIDKPQARQPVVAYDKTQLMTASIAPMELWLNPCEDRFVGCGNYQPVVSSAKLRISFDLGAHLQGSNALNKVLTDASVPYHPVGAGNAKVTLALQGFDREGNQIINQPLDLSLTLLSDGTKGDIAQQLFELDFKEKYSLLRKFVITISTASASTDPIKNQLRLIAAYQEEFIQPIGDLVPTLSPLLLTPGQYEQLFSWNSPCPQIQSYQFELLRVFERKNESGTYEVKKASQLTETDWSQALKLEVISKEALVKQQLAVVEGSGTYYWRVRAIGNAQQGGATHPANRGKWSDPQVFIFEQPENDINWIYSRTFTEDNQLSEQVTYANRLLQIRQSQTKLGTTSATSENRQVIATQTLQDYSGRNTLQSLPIPVPQKEKLGYVGALLKPSGTNVPYSAADFDSNEQFESPKSADEQGYYSAADKGINQGVADAEGYPFTRTVFTPDGTGRVQEQSGVGKAHRLVVNGQPSHTVKTYYSGVEQDELDRVFGDEAPKASNVHKIVTVDPNNVSSVSYQTKDGKTVATALVQRSSFNDAKPLDYLKDSNASKEISSMLDPGVPDGEGALVSQKTFMLSLPSSVTINYELTPTDQEAICTLCSTCHYEIDILVRKVTKDGSNMENGKEREMAPIFSRSFPFSGSVSCGTQATVKLESPVIIASVEPGNYVLQKRIRVMKGRVLDEQVASFKAHLEQVVKPTDANSVWGIIHGHLNASPPNLTALYTYLDANFPRAQGSLYYEVPLDCGVEAAQLIHIPYLVPNCPKDCTSDPANATNQPAAMLAFLADETGRKQQKLQTIDQLIPTMDEAKFKELIRNLLTDGYSCTKIGEAWQQLIPALPTLQAPQEKVEGKELVFDFKSTFFRMLDTKVTALTTDVPDIAKSYYQFQYTGSAAQQECLKYYQKAKNTSADAIPLFSLLTPDEKVAFLGCLQSGEMKPIDPATLSLEMKQKAEQVCKDACETRRGQFRQALIEQVHFKGKYVEGETHQLIDDPIREPVMMDGQLRTWRIAAGTAYTPLASEVISLCEIENMVESLVERCQQDCKLSPVYGDAADPSRITSYGTAEEIGTAADYANKTPGGKIGKAMFYNFEVRIPDATCPAVSDTKGPFESIAGEPVPTASPWLFAKSVLYRNKNDFFQPTNVQRDQQGSYFVAGKVGSGVVINNIPLQGNSNDFFLAKYNAQGEYIWHHYLSVPTSAGARLESTTGTTEATTVHFTVNQVTSEVVFFCEVPNGGTVKQDGNPFITVPSTTNGFFAKYSSSGNLVWKFLDPDNDRVGGDLEVYSIVNSSLLAQDDQSNIYYVCRTSPANYNHILKKISPQGILAWKSTPFEVMDSYGQVYFDQQANIYYKATVNASTIMRVNNRLEPLESAGTVFIKFNSLGQYQWHKLIKGASITQHQTITGIRSLMNIIIDNQQIVNINININYSLLRGEVLLYELGDNGDFLWQKKYDTKTNSSLVIHSATSDERYYYYLLSYSESTSTVESVLLLKIDKQSHQVDQVVIPEALGRVWYSPLTLFVNKKELTILTLVNDPSPTYGSYSLSKANGLPFALLKYRIQPHCARPAMCFRWTDSPFGKEISEDLPAYDIEKLTCEQATAAPVVASVRTQLDTWVGEQTEGFRRAYLSNCLSKVKDKLTYSFDLGYYHYTLYYYDRAGRLIKTVPPEGVEIQTTPFKVGTTPTIAHRLVTTYWHNSLGQLVRQQSPDGGVSKFYYDGKGQMRFSQNDKQRGTADKPDFAFSYTRYDRLGRVIEVGQANAAGTAGLTWGKPMDAFLQSMVEEAYPTAAQHPEQITRTVYSAPSTVKYPNKAGEEPIGQRFLTNRVSYTYSDEDGKDETLHDRNLTYYSYDPHGNVEWLAQDLSADLTAPAANAMPKRLLKFVGYQYDLISGKVKLVGYNEGQPDQFYHRYGYDGDNRLVKVETSRSGALWETDAVYTYYAHGPLKRTLIGNDHVQGIDYVYTLQGWLKGINHPDLTNGVNAAGKDMGKDGLAGSPNSQVARDAFGMALSYYAGDYKMGGMGTNGSTNFSQDDAAILTNAKQGGAQQAGGNPDRDLYNGNISAWTSQTLTKNYVNRAAVQDRYEERVTGERYTYDELNRIKTSDMLTKTPAGSWSATQEYQTKYTYDGNGNLKTLDRNGFGTNLAMDRLKYVYPTDPVNPSKLISNKLIRVEDSESAEAYDQDVDNQAGTSTNYEYDGIGNLTRDVQSKVKLAWNVYGKVQKVIKDDLSETVYRYDAAGNRTAKLNKNGSTFYVRDGQGNVMSVYEQPAAATEIKLSEQYLYGSTRLGKILPPPAIGGGGSGGTSNEVYIPQSKTLTEKEPLGNYVLGDGVQVTIPKGFIIPAGKGDKSTLDISYEVIYDPGKPGLVSRGMRARQYELTDHLGNVRAVVSDQKSLGTNGSYLPTLQSYANYYAFGMEMPQRNASDYRYGFNAKEKDKSFAGESINSYDYGFRIYNPAIAKFLSVDPLTNEYPWYTPYQFAGNKPIESIDLDGLEEYHFTLNLDKQGQTQLKLISTTIENSFLGFTWTPKKAWYVNYNDYNYRFEDRKSFREFVNDPEGSGAVSIEEHVYDGFNRSLENLAKVAKGRAIEGATGYRRSTPAIRVKRIETKGDNQINESGSGPIKNTIMLKYGIKSVRVFNNHKMLEPTDFVFDPETNTFIMYTSDSHNKPGGHSMLGGAIRAKEDDIVGGRIFLQDGKVKTNEWSGHYGEKWTPKIRQQFKEFVENMTGKEINHRETAPPTPNTF